MTIQRNITRFYAEADGSDLITFIATRQIRTYITLVTNQLTLTLQKTIAYMIMNVRKSNLVKYRMTQSLNITINRY